MTERMDIHRLLQEMRSLKSHTQPFTGDSLSLAQRDALGVKGVAEMPSFPQIMGKALDQVNRVQKQSAALTQSYIKGDPSVDITDVMVASQKSSVAFDAVLQVRNKFIEAYRDVMNMPI